MLFLRFRGALAGLVAPFFSFRMKPGAWYGKSDLVELALHMAVFNSFAEGTAEVLRLMGRAPTGETLLDYVKSLTVEEMLTNAEVQITRAVKLLEGKELRLRNVGLAFDWHDRPYYGKPVVGVVGTKRKRGTCHAFSFLTASVLTAGRRLVLCVLPLQSRENLHAVVLPLIGKVNRWVDGLAYVAFDNGFQSWEFLSELQRRRIPFILPLRDTVKLERRRRWMRYVKRFTYTTQGVTVTVVEAADSKGWRYNLATNLPYTPKRILRLYKRRWGIETSYRMIGQFLPRTTSRNLTVRVFNFLLATLTYNAWVVLNAKARQHVTTVVVKLIYIWSYLILLQPVTNPSPGLKQH